MVNGFVAPALASCGAAVGRDMFLMVWDMNQVLATLGVVAGVAAIVS